jgi:brefeldin A-inhibited guanine nucleotide-exchange protein
MRFLEKEELPHFKFQKDFLKPFEYTMIHNQNPEIRDLVRPPSFQAVLIFILLPWKVLQCLQQMTQARAQNMRSGWRTMFGVFSAASKVLTGWLSSFISIITTLIPCTSRTSRQFCV